MSNSLIQSSRQRCPACRLAYIDRTHFVWGGFRDNCEHCDFEGVSLDGGEYHAIKQERDSFQRLADERQST